MGQIYIPLLKATIKVGRVPIKKELKKNKKAGKSATLVACKRALYCSLQTFHSFKAIHSVYCFSVHRPFSFIKAPTKSNFYKSIYKNNKKMSLIKYHH